MSLPKTGTEIRQSFIDFFKSKGHTFVPSSSIVPGGDQTLLFTNAGMVQFKDVFLGTDTRPYTRAVNSQKCMRVAGKHNDLDDVGRDDTHHTFFEMLGNWSFGDYYKKEAISWAWELLTQVWGIDGSKLYTTCFKDDKGNLPTDEDAFNYWKEQPGMNPEHILYYGRKENFWEMAETGPCGPCSEIHIDRGPDGCDKKGVPGHVCRVNGDCKRYLEIWNLVFMQYNRINQNQFDPLPATHVDTGMGFERIVSIMQGVNSNYRTDLFSPLMDKIRELSKTSVEEMDANFTPYRVVADHTRAATFLIADGVVPGNTSRNYICRMIIRRGARFATKIGLTEPFMAKIAEVVIDNYGSAYPELEKNRKAILDSLTREEKRFQRTVEAGLGYLQEMLTDLQKSNQTVLDGAKAFDLYATHGLPLELTRDVARESNLDVDEAGFMQAMEEHKVQSGAGKAFGPLGGEDVEVYRGIFDGLIEKGLVARTGVAYNPYEWLESEGNVLALFSEGELIEQALVGQPVEVILPKTGFYIESGGQVGDRGKIVAKDGSWEISVDEVRRPAAGVIIHIGTVEKGSPKTGDAAVAKVNWMRRFDTMRNHTATHLLHAQLHKHLGDHARQAGSLVAPDRLRFDFNHPEAIPADVLDAIEYDVNQDILANHRLRIIEKSLQQAMEEGAMALFGEKYGETVRTVTVDPDEPISYELCGGTHVAQTGDIGTFIIISEGSAAAGIRRIEAVTGHRAYEILRERNKALKKTAHFLNVPLDEVPAKVVAIQDNLDDARKEIGKLRQAGAADEFNQKLASVPLVNGVPVLTAVLKNADVDTLRQMCDLFRQKYPSGVVALGSVSNDKPMIICAITDDLVKRGLNAGEIVKTAAAVMGGSGGGRPNLAQAGGKDADKLNEAIDQVLPLVQKKL
ncbi:MAG: alanine--tRNA ligase [Anaerolineaceae bacterium]|nr:alanine--tRNA ligase [Anaerolineaceae bacterium]